MSSQEEEEEEEEEEDCYITFTTSESRCDALFDRGIDMVAQGDPNAALSAFLETLTALQDCQYTIKLLPTLYQVAEIYRVLGEVEKSREVSETVSIMQEALDAAMKEKWRERKRLRRSWSAFQDQQQTDCGALFLDKAEECLGMVHELLEKADVEGAVESAERVFRILQYTLGPQHPRTLQSLRDLATLHVADDCICVQLTSTSCVEPIVFTATIKSLCSQFSEQSIGNPTSTSASVTLSGITLRHSSQSAPITSSIHSWGSFEDSLPSTSSQDEASSPENCITEEEEEEGERVKTPPLPLPTPGSEADTQSSPSSQDVYTASQQLVCDKTVREFHCQGSDNDSSCNSRNGGGFSGFSSNLLPLSLFSRSTNLASIFTLFVAFGLMAVAALSIY